MDQIDNVDPLQIPDPLSSTQDIWSSESTTLHEFLKDKEIKWEKANEIEYCPGASFGMGLSLTFIKLTENTIGYYVFDDDVYATDDIDVRNIYDKNKKIIGKIRIDIDEVGYPPLSIIKTTEIVPLVKAKVSKEIANVKFVSSHRKAFVDFINDGYYKEILNKTAGEESLDVYQVLVKNYLSLETPYRGLLVYHGLGTGKTASAVSTAENLSADLRIRTLLPASLEGEFIKEIKKWGKNELDMKNTLWRLIPFTEVETTEVRKDLFKQYKMTPKIIKRIFTRSKALVKKNIVDNFVGVSPANIPKQLSDEYRIVEGDLVKAYGFWIPDKAGRKYDTLTEYEKIVLSEQTSEIILLKYNFIHYNPLPKIKGNPDDDITESDADTQELYQYMNDDDITVSQTRNAEIVQELEEKLKYNRENHNINSPFHNEVIIIDEVHNFVRKILNNSGPSRQFYEWIINAEKIKLIFLSGTPIINKPCEIAILYNMLKGSLRVYTFTINSPKDTDDITHELNKIIYDDISPIELFFVRKVDGRIVISFTQNTMNFVSVRNPENGLIYTAKENDYGYEDFISSIFDVLTKIFSDKEDIIPSAKQALTIVKDKEIIFDETLKIPFNRTQKLFDLIVNNERLDLTNNEKFMEYFFDDSLEIPDAKKTLLRRMLMGLTSYYPIDRSKVVTMPTIKQPLEQVGRFEDYTISQNMNIVQCPMSKIQLEKYHRSWSDENKLKDFNRKKKLFNENADELNDYSIRTRQDSNIVYANDDFRYQRNDILKSKEKKEVYNELEKLKSLRFDENLKYLSPKIYKIYENINKFKDAETPKGKALIYSQFRGDAGLEAVEAVLKINGYAKYDPNSSVYDKRLRYTFITGQEKNTERKQNKEAFNHVDNKYGEYIQLILISESGAEGISLTCVRQVHILEPYWNNVRVNQVFGRAIRLHSHDDLAPKERTVEEYIYLSVLPPGENAHEIYQSIKDWDNIGEINTEKLVEELSKAKNKDIKDTIDVILSVGSSIDVDVFNIMEKKFKISEKITDIVKTSALDCIPHTRDDKTLNAKCVRFSNSLKHEISYFPGITSSELIYVDRQQIKANFRSFIKPDNHILLGDDNKYYYYRNNSEDMDIRYLKENSRLMCELDVNSMEAHVFFEGKHGLTEEFGKYFSVYQDIYDVSKYGDTILDEKLPSYKDIIASDLLAHKIKYNMNETYFYSLNSENKLRTMVRYEDKDEWTSKTFIVHEDELYETVQE
jgi:hypothetical protein|tara:strand:- start:4174 stop:7887 length:3714 start_codon:yes stop_codon:yes gene_type:complete